MARRDARRNQNSAIPTNEVSLRIGGSKIRSRAAAENRRRIIDLLNILERKVIILSSSFFFW
ncbi:hypothetical protein MIMGU_mgv1a022838mg [Erythranthe guttata]|uniref:Uncharacterized protein n=1 Tax=Erythranthe guttata TaxID=4155 RepID=A0A022PYZ1_ERYGU|nr:hypothetical protein MIMGU_mgv1a022838mg [Erythranthe guttata]